MGLLSENRLVVALVGGVVGSLLTQFAQNYYKNKQYNRETILKTYSEFGGFISSDIIRANTEIAISNTTSPSDAARPEFMAIVEKLNDSRFANGREMSRLLIQIRILEPNKELVKLANELVGLQPFMAYVLPRSNGEAYQKRLTEYQEKVVSLKHKFDHFIERVSKKYRG